MVKREKLPHVEKARYGEGFKPGYIFGELAQNPSTAEARATLSGELRRFRKNDKFRDWTFNEAPLEQYGHGVINFKSELAWRLEEARAKRKKVSVLDIGVGVGTQWLDLLKHGAMDFQGTSASRSFHPDLKGKIRICQAKDLHEKFAPSSFDVVSSHCGMHLQELAGFENIVHLLKPNGLGVVTVETIGGGSAPLKNAFSTHPNLIKLLGSVYVGGLETIVFTKLPAKK